MPNHSISQNSQKSNINQLIFSINGNIFQVKKRSKKKTAQKSSANESVSPLFNVNIGVESRFATIMEQGAQRHSVFVAVITLKFYSFV